MPLVSSYLRYLLDAFYKFHRIFACWQPRPWKHCLAWLFDRNSNNCSGCLPPLMSLLLQLCGLTLIPRWYRYWLYLPRHSPLFSGTMGDRRDLPLESCWLFATCWILFSFCLYIRLCIRRTPYLELSFGTSRHYHCKAKAPMVQGSSLWPHLYLWTETLNFAGYSSLKLIKGKHSSWMHSRHFASVTEQRLGSQYWPIIGK